MKATISRDAGWTAVLLQGLTLVVVVVGAVLFVTASEPIDEITGILVGLTGLVIGLLSTIARSVADLQDRVYDHDGSGDHLYAELDEVIETIVSGHDDPKPVDSDLASAYERVDKYHDDAGKQLQGAHTLAQWASFLGFAIVSALGVAAAATGSTESATVVGVVTAIGAAFSAFISRTFQRTYERALVQRMQYAQQPMDSVRAREAIDAAKDMLGEISNPLLRDEAAVEITKALCASILHRPHVVQPTVSADGGVLA